MNNDDDLVRVTWKTPTTIDTIKQHLLSGLPMSVMIIDLGIRAERLTCTFHITGAIRDKITSTGNQSIVQYVLTIKNELNHRRDDDTELTHEHRKVLLDIINSFSL